MQLTIVKVGSNERPATTADLADIQKQLEHCIKNKNTDHAILVTHHEVQFQQLYLDEYKDCVKACPAVPIQECPSDYKKSDYHPVDPSDYKKSNYHGLLKRMVPLEGIPNATPDSFIDLQAKMECMKKEQTIISNM